MSTLRLGQAGTDLSSALLELSTIPTAPTFQKESINMSPWWSEVIDIRPQKDKRKEAYEKELKIWREKEAARIAVARNDFLAIYNTLQHITTLLGELPTSTGLDATFTAAQLRYRAPYLGAIGQDILVELADRAQPDDAYQTMARILGPIICAYLNYEPVIFHCGFANLATLTHAVLPVEYTSELKYLTYLPELQHLELASADFNMEHVGKMTNLKTLAANNYNPSIPEELLFDLSSRHYQTHGSTGFFPEFNFLKPLSQCTALTTLSLNSYQWSLIGLGRLPLVTLNLNAYMDNDGGQFAPHYMIVMAAGDVPPTPDIEPEWCRYMERQALPFTKKVPLPILNQNIIELSTLHTLEYLSLNGYRGGLGALMELRHLKRVELNSHHGHLDPIEFPKGLPVVRVDLTR